MSPGVNGNVRLAELVATLSLATDLGTGQPTEAALRTCWLSIALGQEMGLGDADLSDVYYVALLRHVGCTADAYEAAAFAGGDDLSFWRAISPFGMGEMEEVFAALAPYVSSPGVEPRLTPESAAGVRSTATAFTLAHCEVAEMLAARIGLAPEVCMGLRHSFERWDGEGVPHGVAEEEIAISARVATTGSGAWAWTTSMVSATASGASTLPSLPTRPLASSDRWGVVWRRSTSGSCCPGWSRTSPVAAVDWSSPGELRHRPPPAHSRLHARLLRPRPRHRGVVAGP